MGLSQRFLLCLHYPYLPSPLALVIWRFASDTHSQCAPLCVAMVTRCAETAGGGSFRRIRP